MPTSLQLRSLVTSAGELRLSLEPVEVPDPGPDEVVVRVEAAPVHPSDLALLLGPADLKAAAITGSPESPVVTAPIPAGLRRLVATRVDQSMTVGNEGAGTVVRAGSSPAAQALLGRTVAVFGGSMLAQHRSARADEVLPLPEGTSAADGAAAFVNPLTALAMVETMRSEGHSALVHTAAASTLGQMLVKWCRAEGVPLVNVVRNDAGAAALAEVGAQVVVRSDAPTFAADLQAAIKATGATLAFDAVGGGPLAGQILTAMEIALSADAPYSRYGSSTHKQVYVYGRLDPSPTQIGAGVGMSWGVGGFLVMPFLRSIGPAGMARLRGQVLAGLHTTFASRYTRVVGLAELLQPDTLAACNRRATGEKFLVDPSR